MQLDMNLTVTLGDKDVRLGDLLVVDQTNLSNEFSAQSARFAYVAVLAAIAKGKHSDAVRKRKAEEGTAFVEYKNDEEYIPKGSRTVSDGVAQSLVNSDNDCMRARHVEARAEEDMLLLQAVRDALRMRADMLQSLGASLRHEQEMEGMVTRDVATATKQAIRKRKKEG